MPRSILLTTLSMFILAFFLLAAGCSQPEPGKPPEIGFYYWKTVFSPTNEEKTFFKDSQASRLYLRFFDVVANPETADPELSDPDIVPVATVVFRQKPELPVTPVVFIDNRPLINLGEEMAEDLAGKIVERVNKILTGNKLQVIKELQIDCDWTESTQGFFFALLKDIKSKLPEDWVLCVTLRLFQYRHMDKIGIPPADRVVLMAYNMGRLREPGERNSIIDAKVASTYLAHKPYPLPLDLALPLFSWGVIFDEKDAYKGLVRRLPKTLRSGSPEAPWKKEDGNVYRAEAEIRLEDRVIPKGWSIRVEQTDERNLAALAKELKKSISHADNVIFYHLDETISKEWSGHVLYDTANMFR